MPPRRNIAGRKFNHLTAIRFLYVKEGRAVWLFKCDLCNSETAKKANYVISESSKSCGCMKNAGHANHKHGKRATKAYSSWKAMRQRCNDSNSVGYKNYGGRGIKVCKEWDDFNVFLSDVGEAPSSKHSLERIDNDGDYKPSNVIWATKDIQSRNTRQSTYITYNGETLIIEDWAKRIGIKTQTLRFRIYRGWPIEKAMTHPVGVRNWKYRPF